MRLYEHEAKRVFADAGISTPRRLALLRSVDELRKSRLRFPAMVKAQVLVGGRGKAGGIRKVAADDEARSAARELLGMRIGGYGVESVLVEEAVEHSAACYLGVTVNPATCDNVVIASASGGVDIETVARDNPDAILRIELPDNPAQLPRGTAKKIAGLLQADVAEVASVLYDVFQRTDAKLVEINPLLITPNGPFAADAKMVLDENALYRQGELLKKLGIEGRRHDVAEPTANERRAFESGYPYVDLLSEGARREPGKVYVGLVPGGAGYGIFSIDEVDGIGRKHFDGRVVPLNFMDSGGGPTVAKVVEMFAILMDNPLVDVVITSRFGGVSSCDIFIRGLIECLRSRRAKGERIIPVYGRMVGTDLAAARAYLEKAKQETPEDLAPLSMVVGNREIMAEVIREGLEDFLKRREAQS